MSEVWWFRQMTEPIRMFPTCDPVLYLFVGTNFTSSVSLSLMDHFSDLGPTRKKNYQSLGTLVKMQEMQITLKPRWMGCPITFCDERNRGKKGLSLEDIMVLHVQMSTWLIVHNQEKNSNHHLWFLKTYFSMEGWRTWQNYILELKTYILS